MAFRCLGKRTAGQGIGIAYEKPCDFPVFDWNFLSFHWEDPVLFTSQRAYGRVRRQQKPGAAR